MLYVFSLYNGVNVYTFEDLNPHAVGVLFISFKGNVRVGVANQSFELHRSS